MNFTYNNHLYYTIGDRKYGYRQNSYEKFNVHCGQIDPVVYKQSSWENELIKTADYVLSEFGKVF